MQAVDEFIVSSTIPSQLLSWLSLYTAVYEHTRVKEAAPSEQPVRNNTNNANKIIKSQLQPRVKAIRLLQ